MARWWSGPGWEVIVPREYPGSVSTSHNWVNQSYIEVFGIWRWGLRKQDSCCLHAESSIQIHIRRNSKHTAIYPWKPREDGPSTDEGQLLLEHVQYSLLIQFAAQIELTNHPRFILCYLFNLVDSQYLLLTQCVPPGKGCSYALHCSSSSSCMNVQLITD